MSEIYCRKCKRTANCILSLGLIAAFGAKVYPSPEICCDGGEHEFVTKDSNEEARR